MRRALEMLWFLVLILLAADAAWAQISPGPLSSSHASLEGNSNCVRCHGLKKESIEERCLECHSGIAFLRDENRGFHGREGKKACEDCHPEHAGEDFELIEWPDKNAKAFRHERSGWRLEGAHTKIECKSCHRSELQTGTAAQREPAGRAHDGQGWLGLETSCAHCHRDPHHQRLGADCRACHGMDAWRPVPSFDHSLSAYPLDGRHLELTCAQCHENPALGAEPGEAGKLIPVYSPIAHADCRDCHRDPHLGRFAGSCSGCHVTAGFALAKGSGFDHSLTAFPLAGAHATESCESCHDEQKAWGKRPAHDRCDRCHSDAHAGQLVAAERATPDCDDCHTQTSWRGVDFGLDRHAQSGFALEGAHAKAQCASCHRSASEETPDPAWGTAGVRLRMPSQSCVDCHLVAHGDELGENRSCAECHGQEVWSPSTFDAARHASSGWPLEEAHLRASCESCHGPGDAGTDSLAGVSSWKFASLGRACLDCHLDPHAARYEDRADWSPESPCRGCHGMDTFSPSELDPAQHAELGLPLEGAHRAVPCIACHEELLVAPIESTLRDAGETPRDLSFRSKGRACRDCHDPATLGSSGDRS